MADHETHSGSIGMERYIYTTIGGLSSKFEEFLAGRSQFDSDHGVDFSAPTCCLSAIFVRPLFVFYCTLLFTGENNVAFRHRRDVYVARLMVLLTRYIALRERWCRQFARGRKVSVYDSIIITRRVPVEGEIINVYDVFEI